MMVQSGDGVTGPQKFEFLEHTADAYIVAYGKDMAEAFESAAYALFDVMTETQRVAAEIEDHVKVESTDKHGLLYDWLEALLVRFDTKEMLYSKFQVQNITKTSNSLRLEAKIWGSKFDPAKHPQKVGVKAVTYHRMKFIEEPNKVSLYFILDI